MTMTAHHKSQDGAAYSAAKVRQGEIILRARWQRAVFLFGLAGALVLPLVMIIVSILTQSTVSAWFLVVPAGLILLVLILAYVLSAFPRQTTDARQQLLTKLGSRPDIDTSHPESKDR